MSNLINTGRDGDLAYHVSNSKGALKVETSCHSPRGAQLYNAYARLQLFARSEILGIVPYVVS